MINRQFKDIPKGGLKDSDQQSFLVSLGRSKALTWEKLLESQRILIISEAGAGKTYECQEMAKRLWADGEPAFFIELATLADDGLRPCLDSAEEKRLDEWLAAQSDTATFFLDSIDELKLSSGSFERALKRLKKCIESHLHRVRIIITSRPIPIDEKVFRLQLPVTSVISSEANEESFAMTVMQENKSRDLRAVGATASPLWRSVGLMPLSYEQIASFAAMQGVEDPAKLLLT
jgi:hypothetical protein